MTADCVFCSIVDGAAPASVVHADDTAVAFQLSDDLLDITADRTESGKVPGTDLREGIPTLPVLFALRGARSPGGDRTDAARLRELLSGPVPEESISEALALLRASPGIDAARSVLRSYADRARALLTTLPDLPARGALEALADFVVSRTG